MNRKLVGHLLGAILLIEAACMVPALVVALIYQDEDVWAMGKAILLLAAIGAPMRFGIRPQERNLRAREGYLVVALARVALRCFGVWCVMLMVSHYVSLSSMVAGCCFPVFTLISPKVNGSTPFVVFSFVIAVLLIYTHRKNIERLKAGTESKIYIWKPRRMNPGDGAERKDKDHGPK